ncbi:SRPBCC family protein [Streptomyces sp. NBC_01016]|uniref:SRPBCC family protein n=1 Tax=Streptomyces sp. NBC_01016 TaxID=2903720 RepID=UPI0022573A16|nr:SRPBCC family protein [Streptomyces sp. NBC_01016]MCX4831342.1 SRPBCC family protein [Streptomyces sp. NBC_01016]
MKLENTFAIPVPVDEAWKVLLDVERVAPCVPGATLTGSEGDTHQGRIKVKLGPISLTYSGTVTFVTRDEDAKVVVLEAGGREARGNGTAKARVTCRLSTAGPGHTDVHVETDLSVTGRPAQFGRGTLAEVSGALMGRFAENLAAELTIDSPQPLAGSVPAAPLDLADTPSARTVKRVAPIAVTAAAALLWLALARRGRRHR